MTTRLVAVTFDVGDPGQVATFWSRLLDRDVVTEADGVLLPGDETRVGLRFTTATTERHGRNRLHLHLTSESLDDQRRTVQTALDLGGRPFDVGQLPEEEHVVLADPGGNEFCVIEPGNGFLAGCGRLGEVACDGTRATGLFWRDALGWPLVWDRGEETAVQSPAGGTKLSWGGTPPPPEPGRTRQRFDLATTDPATEAERLVALGATRLRDRSDDGVALTDPDGNEFSMTPG